MLNRIIETQYLTYGTCSSNPENLFEGGYRDGVSGRQSKAKVLNQNQHHSTSYQSLLHGHDSSSVMSSEFLTGLYVQKKEMQVFVAIVQSIFSNCPGWNSKVHKQELIKTKIRDLHIVKEM
eukprot:6474167-Amphidinium_carterae.1